MSPSGERCEDFSRRRTEWPLRSHSMAAVRPAKPAPTMMMEMLEEGPEWDFEEKDISKDSRGDCKKKF